jgi:hypothetical protein
MYGLHTPALNVLLFNVTLFLRQKVTCTSNANLPSSAIVAGIGFAMAVLGDIDTKCGDVFTAQ